MYELLGYNRYVDSKSSSHYRASGTLLAPYCCLKGKPFELPARSASPPLSCVNATVLGVIGLGNPTLFGVFGSCKNTCLCFSQRSSFDMLDSGLYCAIFDISTSVSRAAFSVLVGIEEQIARMR